MCKLHRNRSHNLFGRCIAVVFTAMFLSLSCILADAHGAGSSSDQYNVFLADVSASMSTEQRVHNLKELVKAGAFVLRGDLSIVPFSDDARQSPIFDLKSQFNDAISFADSFQTGGGTRFMPPLRAVTKSGSGRLPNHAVMISDGAPSESPDDILQFLRQNATCPVHTIAVQTDPDAEQLLGKIAAATGGGCYRAHSAEDVVDAFLNILRQLSGFRQHEMTSDELRLRDATGEILVIGFGVEPRIDGSDTVERHTADMPNEQLYLARAIVAHKTDLVIRRPGSAGRVVIIRFDLPTANLRLSQIGTSNNTAQIQADITFRDASGSVDLATVGSHLTAGARLLDGAGKVQKTVIASPTSDGKTLRSVLEVPTHMVGQPWSIHCVTADRSSDGIQFRSSEVVAVDLNRISRVDLPTAKPVTANFSTIGRPAPAATQSPDKHELALELIAHRPSGIRLLMQSGQPNKRCAFVGDKLEVDLVRINMPAKQFASLVSGVKARFISKDGAIRSVPLHLNGDRFSSDPVTLRQPGTLTVFVDIGTAASKFSLSGVLQIKQAFPVMVLNEHSLQGRLGRVPYGTLIPFRLEFEGQTHDKSKISRDELEDILQQTKYEVRWLVRNSTGEVLDQATHAVQLDPWDDCIWLNKQRGHQTLSFELREEGRVIQSIRGEFDLSEPVVAFRVDQSGHNFPWVHCLPSWLVKTRERLVTASPTNSDIFTTHYLDGIVINGDEAQFNEQLGTFSVSSSAHGVQECVARLKPLQRSMSEILLRDVLDMGTDEAPDWIRLSGIVALTLSVAWALARLLIEWRLSSLDSAQISLVGGQSIEPLVLVKRGGSRLWPSRTVFAYQSGPDESDIEIGYRVPFGCKRVARVHQHLSGKVCLRLLSSTSGVSGSGTERVMEFGDSDVDLTASCRLMIDFFPALLFSESLVT